MLKAALVLAAAIVVSVVVVLILATNKPDTFRVTRAIDIKAPPEKIFPLIADFHRWTTWSPYEKKDPAMKRSYGGPSGDVGQTYAWDGDKNVGAGRMTLVEASTPSRIQIKLDFARPFEAHNVVAFSLAPHGDTTTVTWDMQGPAPLLAKIVHVFINMDKMVGSDFEIGLANLKTVAEKQE